MEIKEVQSILTIGETVAVEFKRCGNGIENDTYETVCSFLNRFGGDLFMGILDDGTVVGIPEKAAPDMVKNFIKVISNPTLFSPTIYLVPEIIKYDESHTIIHVHILPSAEVHSFKKVIYDRVDDADIKITSTSAIAQMYIRKQNIFTEKKIYPYAKMEDLRLDLLPKIRIMAQNHAGGQHPWTTMDDQELLKSAGLYGRDIVTGEEGFNLAAIMLLGKDDESCLLYEQIHQCDLLIIDDLGTERNTDFVVSQLFVCLNDRILNRKSTIISTNLTLEEIKTNYTERTFSRISNHYKILRLAGDDIRIQKKLMYREEH